MAKKAPAKPKEERAPSPLLVAMGRKIAFARDAAKLSQEDLAEAVGLSVSQISRFESAKRRAYVDDIFRIARSLDIPVGRLFGERETSVRVAGLVGAGATVEQIGKPETWDAPEKIDLPCGPHIRALLVEGDSQLPKQFPGDFILYDVTPRTPGELVGQYAVVETLDGRRLAKTIRPGAGDKWLLESVNGTAELTALLAAYEYRGTIAKRGVSMPKGSFRHAADSEKRQRAADLRR